MRKRNKSAAKYRINGTIIVCMLWVLAFWFFTITSVAFMFGVKTGNVFNWSVGIFAVMTVALIIVIFLTDRMENLLDTQAE